MIKNFRAFQLSKDFYQLVKPLRLPSHLKDHLIRASSPVSLNLAEASGRRSEKEQIRFYTVAFGSLRECEAILELEQVEDKEIRSLMDQLGAILYKLCRFSAQTKRELKKEFEIGS